MDKEHVGDVMGDLNSRRGKVLGMDATEKYEVVKAQVPQSEILLYAADLTSMTGGRGRLRSISPTMKKFRPILLEKL